MFTQCEKCKATFRVNLREVTVAKGRLRCGECYTIFDATKTLSTSMPTAFQETIDLDLEVIDHSLSSVSRTKSIPSNVNQKKPKMSKTVTPSAERTLKTKTKNSLSPPQKLLLIVIALLVSLFIFQVRYNIKLKKTEESLHEPNKIQMLSYNVFAHPNETGVLLISASMENNAKRAQPYPIIEVLLSDSKSKVIALRRFRPYEYLKNYKKGMMLAKDQQSKINLKISDPGSKATKFQYKFF